MPMRRPNRSAVTEVLGAPTTIGEATTRTPRCQPSVAEATRSFDRSVTATTDDARNPLLRHGSNPRLGDLEDLVDRIDDLSVEQSASNDTPTWRPSLGSIPLIAASATNPPMPDPSMQLT